MGSTDQEASSFGFLAPYGPLYLQRAIAAERTLAIDPNLTLVSLRQLAEAFAKHAAGRAGLISGDRRDAQITQVDLLRLLEQRGIVRDKIADCFHMLRQAGNAAVHDFVGSRQQALDALAIAFRLACWFHKTFGDNHARTAWQPPRYEPPSDPTSTLRALQEDAAKARAEADAHKADAERAKALLDAETARRDEEARLRKQAEAERAEWEKLAAAYEADLAKAAAEQAKVEAQVIETAAQAPAEQEKLVVAQAAAATAATELDEAETRVLIDAQLRAAGWEVNSKTLRWSHGARPEKGKNRAIAEVPTHSKDDGDGLADYVIFVGLQPYAVVEAKRKNKKVPSHLEQAKRYSRSLAAVVPHADATHAAEGGALAWGWKTSLTAKPTDLQYVVPFLYSTNGRPYLRQLEAESGVWFLDVQPDQPPARAHGLAHAGSAGRDARAGHRRRPGQARRRATGRHSGGAPTMAASGRRSRRGGATNSAPSPYGGIDGSSDGRARSRIAPSRARQRAC